jgi:hypothetical protein
MILLRNSNVEYFTDPIETTGDHVPHTLCRWQPGPSELLPRLIQMLQRPAFFNPRPGGSCHWKKDTLLPHGVCFHSITLADKSHNYLTFEYELPLGLFRSSAQIMKSIDQLSQLRFANPDVPPILYDPRNSILTSKGTTINEVIANLVVAKRLLLGELSLQQSQNLLDHLRHSPLYEPDAILKLTVELCSVGLPKINSLGALSPTEIYTLRTGGLPKEEHNMTTDAY